MLGLHTAKRHFEQVDLDRIIHASPTRNTEDVGGANYTVPVSIRK